MTLYSLGSINLDVQMRVDGPIPASGLVLGRDLAWLPGGKAANVAVLGARLGVDAVLIGAVGDDELGELALVGPREEGVDVEPVVRLRAPTAASCVFVGPDGDKAICLAPGANDAWSDDVETVQEVLGSARPGSVLALDLEIPEAAVAVALAAVDDGRLPVVVDPSPTSRASDAVLGAADHLTPDHHEARDLTGIEVASVDDARRAGEALRARGVGTAHVKLADGGCVVSGREGDVAVVPPDVDAVDTTGAGDAFTGGLSAALVAGADPVEAARSAVAASTCAVRAYGSQDAYPTAAALDDARRRVTVSRLD